MKCVLQLVRREDGTRTSVITEERSFLANLLIKMLKEEDCKFNSEDYVLVLAEVSEDDQKGFIVDFSVAPMMTVAHFTQSFATTEIEV